MQGTLSVSLMALLFGMLWLPLGQEGYLYEHWMNIGVFGAAFLMLGAVLFTQDDSEPRLRNVRFVSALLFAAYTVHQFEEHGVDFLGRRYAFVPFLNDLLRGRFTECAEAIQCPLNPENTFYVNTTLVWLVMLLAVWAGRRLPFVGLCAAGIVVVNGLLHVVQGIALRSYNPGLITSVALFLPLGTYAYWLAWSQSLADRVTVAASLAWAIGAHVVLLAGVVAIYVHHWLPEPFYLMILILYSISPLALFRKYFRQF